MRFFLVPNHFGGLYCLPPPLNLLSIIFIPFYICLRKDTAKRARLDRIVNLISYVLVFLPFALLIMGVDLLLLPLAYLKILLMKICNIGTLGKLKGIKRVFLWLIFGLPNLVILYPFNAMVFLWHLFAVDLTKKFTPNLVS